MIQCFVLHLHLECRLKLQVAVWGLNQLDSRSSRYLAASIGAAVLGVTDLGFFKPEVPPTKACTMPALPLSSGVLDFGLGAALIVAPQYKLPLSASVALLGIGRRLSRRKSADPDRHSPEQAGDVRVHLRWSDVTCTLTDKKGRRKTLLKGLAGHAKPGR